MDEDGKVIASLVPTGVRPRFVEKLAAEGIATLPEDIFKTPTEA